MWTMWHSFYSIHSSIHHPSIFLSQSQLPLFKRWTHRQPITGLTYRDRQPFTLTFTTTSNLESPMNLTFLVLGLFEEALAPGENPSRHVKKNANCRSFLLWGDHHAALISIQSVLLNLLNHKYIVLLDFSEYYWCIKAPLHWTMSARMIHLHVI